MIKMWHERIQSSKTTENGVAADYRLTQGSFWFDGHFPDNPVLPGVAQLAMVMELIQSQHLRASLKVVALRRVRFKQMIGPEDSLTVTVSRRSGRENCYDFQILKGSEPACSGMMTVALSFGIEL